MASIIHPTAIVAPGAELGEGVDIGPYCIVGPKVRLGAGTRLMAHVFLDGRTSLGNGCTVFPFASIGTQTQDLKFRGGEPRVEIGDKTVLREYSTVNAATFDGGVTKVGSGCLIMAYAHVAHDCLLGNRVIMANAVNLAGHVVVEDQAIVGGVTGVHQFVRIGRLSIIGGCSRVTKDVPPFMMAAGSPLEVTTINSIGLERAGISSEVQADLKRAFKTIYRENLTATQAVEKIRTNLTPGPELESLLTFVLASERGIAR